MTSISAVIITRDKTRAKNTIDSVSFADELLVSEEKNIDDYSAVRNRMMRKAKHKWVLFVDDDEIITKDLRIEIQEAIKSDQINGYFMRREDMFLGRVLKHGENAAIRILRLAKKDKGVFERPVHEIWTVKGRVGELESPLLHYPHISITSFLEKINNYSTIEANFRHKIGKKSSLVKLSLFPLLKLINNYILKLGFLDGTPGFIMAVMMSFHSFQTWTKLYLLQNKS